MVKTILWDFDGVILDSMKIKGDGFRELFKEHGEEYVEAIKTYHYNNGGVSRFDKIYYFYNHILGQKLSEKKMLLLAEQFATLIEEKLYNRENLIDDTIQFIQKYYEKYNFHIVSGAEHQELNILCNYLDITKYFKSIDGSPTKKNILVKNVLKKYNYQKNEVILIGDALSDYNAAKENKIGFYGYNNPKLQKFPYYIESFKDFNI